VTASAGNTTSTDSNGSMVIEKYINVIIPLQYEKKREKNLQRKYVNRDSLLTICAVSNAMDLKENIVSLL